MNSELIISKIFNDIKNSAQTIKSLQVMYAIRKVFPPKKNINKFITGGAVEEVLTRMIGSCGLECKNVSSTESLIDIIVDNQFPYSIKSIQKLGSSIVIENYRGQKREISKLSPTIFVVLEGKETIFAYMDEEIIKNTGLPNDQIYNHADSNLSMKGSFLKMMIKEKLPPHLVLKLQVPEIPELPEEDISVIAVERVMSMLK